MEEKEYEQRLNILLEENRKKQLLIINSLNAIGYAIMGKLYSNIKIIEEDYFITFDLVKLKFNYLKQLLEEDSEPYSLEWFSLLAFEILFFDTNNFNVDNLEEKVKCFKIIINEINKKYDKQNKENSNDNDIHKKIILEKYQNNKTIKNLYQNVFLDQLKQDNIGFLCVIILSNNPKPIQFFNFFVKALESKLNIKIDLDEKDIEKLTINKIVGDLINIFTKGKKVDKIHLIFKDNKICCVPFTDKEATNEIKYDIDESLSNQFRNIILNNDISNLSLNDIVIQELEKDIIAEDSKESNKNEKDEQKINEKGKKRKKKKKNKKKTNVESSNKKVLEENQAKVSENTIESEGNNNDEEDDEIKNLILKNKKLNNKCNKLMSFVEKLNNEINLLKKENINYKQNKQKIDMKLKSTDIKLSNLREDNMNIKGELIRVKNELKIIEQRDAFKAFIDYIYHSLGFKEVKKYKNKVYDISHCLDGIKSKNIILVSNLMKLIDEIYIKFNQGNSTAHGIKLNEPILSQMFESVKDKNFAPELLNKLDKSNTETVMKNLIIVRKNFFYDKSMIEQEEEKIYVTVPDLKKALFEQN